jgi:hypothetical protein
MQAIGNNNMGALEMHNQGLAIREKVLGKEHPDTAESYNNVGLLMQAMGNAFTEVLRLMRKTLKSRHIYE